MALCKQYGSGPLTGLAVPWMRRGALYLACSALAVVRRGASRGACQETADSGRRGRNGEGVA